MTYRDAIQLQIKALQEIYDNAGSLRDVAGNDYEKEAFNSLRRSLPLVWNVLQKVDNRMPDSTARQILKGDYQLKITIDKI